MDTTETIKIQGMTCGHCVAAVKRALEETPGVEVRNVTIGSAEISYDPEVTSHDVIAEAITEEGYAVVEES